MATSSSPELEAPAVSADDLKQIHGIGPGIEARLNAAGIFTYAQLAALSPDEVVLALGNVVGLTVKRVVDQDWVGQAKKLGPVERPGPGNGKAGHQHYATFAIELLLDEGNNVRRTHAVNIQSEAEDTWAGWDEHRLLDFLAQKAGLKIEAHDAEKPIEPAPVSLPPVPSRTVVLMGQAHLSKVRITTIETGRQSRILAEYKPFEIETLLDLSELVVPDGSAVGFAAFVKAKALGENLEQPVGEARGAFETVQEGNFAVQCSGLKEGTYRLQIQLSLNLPGPENAVHPPLTFLLDGGLLKIY